MADVLFVLKSFLVTFILIVLMQIQVGENTIESHAQAWLRESSIVHTLRGVAHGGVKLLSEGYQSVIATLDAKLGNSFNREQMAGMRGFNLRMERTDSARREAADRAKAQARARQEEADESEIEGEEVEPETY